MNPDVGPIPVAVICVTLWRLPSVSGCMMLSAEACCDHPTRHWVYNSCYGSGVQSMFMDLNSTSLRGLSAFMVGGWKDMGRRRDMDDVVELILIIFAKL